MRSAAEETRAAQPARGRPAGDRALGPGPAAGAPGRASTPTSLLTGVAHRFAARARAERAHAARRAGGRAHADRRPRAARAGAGEHGRQRAAPRRAATSCCRPRATTATSSCTCATAAPASRPSSCRAPSSASRAPTRRARAAAPAWAWRSPRPSRARTAARRTPATATQGGADVWLEIPHPLSSSTHRRLGNLMVLPMEIPSTSPLPTGPGRTNAAGVRNPTSLVPRTEEESPTCECW